MLGEPESGKSLREDRRRTHIRKSEFIKFVHRFCDNPLILDFSCSSIRSGVVDARELRLLQRRQKTRGVFGGKRKTRRSRSKVKPGKFL